MLLRILTALPLLIVSPFLVVIVALALAITDLAWLLFGRRLRDDGALQPIPAPAAASVVIPNWNGRDLVEKYLPSVIAALEGDPRNEVLVVDNGSTDGSADFIRERFPTVTLLALPRNEGFGGGSNAGFRAARNNIVVLLNSDMRVEQHFLAPLLTGFADDHVFAVSCQIFFSDPARVREETGLTQAWWDAGRLRVRHRIDEKVTSPFPCFYGGGGSCAFDRTKFLELGGFDPLLAPFYLEDTDLGYMAWKRGWKVLYQPLSHVFHEHRGTIGKKFSHEYIQSILKKNFALFCWKNIHEWRRLLSHFAFLWADGVVSLFFGDSPERGNLGGLWKAFLQIPRAVRSRWMARSLGVVNDTEAFRRPLGGYYRDRFRTLPVRPETLRVLFVSPYPICPPVHGGGVFMYQTTMELANLCDLHLITLLDYPHELDAHAHLVERCASAEFLLRMSGAGDVASIAPHAIAEFRNADLEWLIHRQILLQEIDVLQLEYMPLGQYAGQFRQIPSILFEHDVYFQSVGRQLGNMSGLRKVKAQVEYLRALKYELGLLPRVDGIQVCSRENKEFLLSFLPRLDGRIEDGLRAGINTGLYDFRPAGRESRTMLFLGSFRHLPNQEALNWFVHQVLRRVLEHEPTARLIVIGSDPPPRHFLPDFGSSIEMHGFVEDIMEPLRRYAVFVCPILSGSGVRVKLLEAFASGIPVVSTTIGAEGLTRADGDTCLLSDDPSGFAERIVKLFRDEDAARELAVRARQRVEAERDMPVITRHLLESYHTAVEKKRRVLRQVLTP